MAQKRMFDKSITNSDDFLDLPDSSQVLYFHLSMNADDDGFVNNWKSIIRMTGTKEDDMKILVAKQFVIPFDSGVIVIRHWRINNYLRNDRYKETKHKEELSCLTTGKNEEYQLKDTTGIPTVYPDKNSIDKNSIDKKERNIKERKIFKKPTIDEIQYYCNERNNGINAEAFYDFYESKDWMVGKNKMKDWKACVRTWEKREKMQTIKNTSDLEDLPKWWDYKEEEKNEGLRRKAEAIRNGTYRP